MKSGARLRRIIPSISFWSPMNSISMRFCSSRGSCIGSIRAMRSMGVPCGTFSRWPLASISVLSTEVSGIDWTARRRSGHSSFVDAVVERGHAPGDRRILHEDPDRVVVEVRRGRPDRAERGRAVVAAAAAFERERDRLARLARVVEGAQLPIAGSSLYVSDENCSQTWPRVALVPAARARFGAQHGSPSSACRRRGSCPRGSPASRPPRGTTWRAPRRRCRPAAACSSGRSRTCRRTPGDRATARRRRS